MAEELERAENRLSNIRSVEPILSALRTISHASWQSARKRYAQANRYQDNMRSLLAQLLSRLPEEILSERFSVEQDTSSITLLAIGTERGLCGNFNREIVAQVKQATRRWQAHVQQVRIWAVGSRLNRRLLAQEVRPERTWKLSSSSLPPYDLAWQMMLASLSDTHAGQLPHLHIIHNTPRIGGRFDTALDQLWPPTPLQTTSAANEIPWPPPILETDPMQLGVRTYLTGLAAQIYALLLESAVAEHSTRFHLMEEASQNAERLMQELNDIVLSARRNAITQEMSELATASGLLDRSE